MIAFVIHLPVLFLVSWWLYQLQGRNAPLKFFFWPGLILKLLAAIALGMIYTYYYSYGGDTFAFFNDAVVLGKLAQSDPASYLKILLFNQYDDINIIHQLGLWQQQRALFMAKLISILSLFAFHNYWVIALYLSFFSFYGMWRLANIAATIYPSSWLAAGGAFLLFPSVVFWSSGLLKESVVMGCMGLSLAIFLSCYAKSERPSFIAWICVVLSCYFLWKLKFYYLAVLLPAIAACIGADFLIKKRNTAPAAFIQIVFLVGIYSLMIVGTSFLHPALHLDKFLQSLILNHELTMYASSPANVIHFHDLQATLFSLVKNLPLALFSGLFRPLPWESHSLFQLFTALENLLLLLLLLFIPVKKPISILPQKTSSLLLLTSTLLYIALLATLLAFASPNLGTLARYKVGFLPFLVYLLIWGGYGKKVSECVSE